jgi:hypothetical protein
MKILLWICLFLGLGATVFGQKTFEVQDFSDNFYGKVHIEEPSEVFSKGWVGIFEKKTDRQLIKLDVEQLTTPDGEQAKANVKELPYGEQSQIIYDDFNFDGVKDFAIMDGQNSCYGGPSFQIYLAGKGKNKFVLNPDFTRLAQDYCGMFDVDAEKKTISTMVKSGCCWHEFSEFIVIGNKPRAIKIVEEELGGLPFVKTTTQTWKGNKMVKTTSRTADFKDSGDVAVLMSFKTANNSEVVLFIYGEELQYAFVDKTGNVEFTYPHDAGSEQEISPFTLDAKGKQLTLSFTNKGVTYKIDEIENEKIAVLINAKGKLTAMAGNPATRKGSLRQLTVEKLSNVVLKK